MPDCDTLDSIAAQLEHRYAVLARLLGEGLTDDLARKRLGSRPPILWHGAHILEAMASTLEAVCLGPGGAPLAEGLREAADRLPETAARARCDLGELRGPLQEVGAMLLAELKSLSLDDLGGPPLVAVHPAFSETLRSRKVWLEGHVFHVTYHLGAIGLLRAEWGLGS